MMDLGGPPLLFGVDALWQGGEEVVDPSHGQGGYAQIVRTIYSWSESRPRFAERERDEEAVLVSAIMH